MASGGSLSGQKARRIAKDRGVIHFGTGIHVERLAERSLTELLPKKWAKNGLAKVASAVGER
jgi:hypothetical protein